MTEAGPLSRVVRVDALPREGQTVTIEASPAEREALATLYGLPAIAALTADRPRLGDLIRRAWRDGGRFNSDTMSRDRSALIRQRLG